MTAPTHITIIGAGLIGLSTADALLRRGVSVTLIDSREPLSGASFANSGMIHPSQACSWGAEANDPMVDAAVLELARDSRARLAARMGALGLASMARRDEGCFQIFETETARNAARTRLAARGVAAEVVEAGTLPLDRPALFFPEDRSGDACLYGQTLLRDVEARGATILRGEASVSMNGSGVTLSVDGETVETDAIILACGWETDALLAPLGLSLGIEPVRGWALDFVKPDNLSLPGAPIMDAQTRSALTVFDDRLRLSGTWGETSPDLLRMRWADLLPDVFSDAREPTLVWSGLRPVSPLGRPFIGRTPFSNLWVNAGHGHMGWTLCAGSGELLAAMMMEGRDAPAFAIPTTSEETCRIATAV